MKKIIIFFIILILISCFVFNNSYSIYDKLMTVTGIDYKNDIVVLKDEDGYLWEFDGCEDWLIGDSCLCEMANNNTPYTIFDDIIIHTIYKG